MTYEPRINKVKPNPQNQQPKKRRYLFRAIIFLVIALPIALYFRYQWEVAPNKYFLKRCADIGGEKIYKKASNVHGFLLARRRDPRDIFSRLRSRDLPEDPYHHTNMESKYPEALFMSFGGIGYSYLEVAAKNNVSNVSANKEYILYTRSEATSKIEHHRIFKSKSKYAVTWSETSTSNDLYFGVHIGEVKIYDTATNLVLAIHTGLFLYNSRIDRYKYCPPIKDSFTVARFVNRVLPPNSEQLSS